MDKVLEAIALEVESFARDLRAALTRIDRFEKTASGFALVMFCAGFLPWFSPNDTHTQSGLDGFGTPHFGIAVATLLLVRRVANERRLKHRSNTPTETRTLENGRIALIFLALGALSTITCIALLVHFGNIAAFPQNPAEVRYGFYLVLASGMGISACGIAKFS